MHRPVGYHRTSGGNGIRRGCSNGRVRHPFGICSVLSHSWALILSHQTRPALTELMKEKIR